MPDNYSDVIKPYPIHTDTETKSSDKTCQIKYSNSPWYIFWLCKADSEQYKYECDKKEYFYVHP